MKKAVLFSLICTALLATSLSTFADEPATDVMSAKYREIWNAEEQARIDADIEANRKADASVALPNVPDGTEVRVVQIDSAFKFGGNTFLFGQFDSEEKNQAYASVFGDLFDAATVAFYWKTLEPERGKLRFEASSPFVSRRPPTDAVVDYCNSRGLDVHGHAIIYGMRRWGHPEWLPADRKGMETFFEEHVRQLAERYGDRVDEWDVVNESIDQANRGLMPDDYVYKTFSWAMKYFPKNVRFSTNECDVSWGPNRRYVEIVRDLIDRGVRVDLVGVQAHLFGADQAAQIAAGADLYTPTKLRAVFKTLEETERPVHVSEITISAPTNDEKGRQIQAEVARNLYRLWFSLP
ncbi:MAG: endo-1,4-beta-xylanase, partial [Thermoguttaceae bacterium]|nr:endo-1,4-beta-xylanase [Thermoguttaceae bacterium]